MPERVDILVIGGGINGASIARDAAGRGFSVTLAEMNDLASGTSSAATKLIHGGLRYLEHFEFRLVAKSLAEREVLWTAAPHIVRPLRFILPHHRGLRPSPIIRIGLMLYDTLGGRKLLPATKTLDLARERGGKPLKPIYKLGFEYSDCWVDDSRLVVLAARDAANHGATILTQTKVIAAEREDGGWSVELEEAAFGSRERIHAKLLINAAGPWVDQVIGDVIHHPEPHHVRLVKGSHIVVRKLYDHDRCYIFQNKDGRVVFAIPYEDDFTLIGTTDIDFDGDPATAKITDVEIDYLIAAVNDYFAHPLDRTGLVWSYAGVRPLFDDGATAAQEATREYVLVTEGNRKSGALINIFGGKLTTSRVLAEEVMKRAEGFLGARKKPWTRDARLPGGEFPPTGFIAELERLQSAYPQLPPPLLKRLVRLYGTRAFVLLGDRQTLTELGEHFGAGLYAVEIDYLRNEEWARTAEDILWRRTKLGLRLNDEAVSRLRAYLEESEPRPAPAKSRGKNQAQQ